MSETRLMNKLQLTPIDIETVSKTRSVCDLYLHAAIQRMASIERFLDHKYKNNEITLEQYKKAFNNMDKVRRVLNDSIYVTKKEIDVFTSNDVLVKKIYSMRIEDVID